MLFIVLNYFIIVSKSFDSFIIFSFSLIIYNCLFLFTKNDFNDNVYGYNMLPLMNIISHWPVLKIELRFLHFIDLINRALSTMKNTTNIEKGIIGLRKKIIKANNFCTAS